MTTRFRFGIALIVVVLLLVGICPMTSAFEKSNRGDTFRLPATMTIRTSADAPSLCYAYAVTELSRLLKRVNVSTTVSVGTLPKGICQIQLARTGTSIFTPSDTKGICADGYRIEITDEGVTLLALEPKGVLNAVYALAERLGYLFLYPGIEGEWAPDLRTGHPTLKTGSAVVNPVFPHRGIFNGNSEKEWVEYYAKLGLNALSNPVDPILAARTGLRVEVGGHDLGGLLPRDHFDKNPDMYRMIQPEDFFGKRINDYNFCTASLEARRVLQENYLRKIKPYIQDGIYAWHTWPEDLPGGGWCYCPTCRSFSSADQAMKSMNLLAEVVRREKLPVRVPMLAYHDTMFPGTKIDAPKECFLLFAPRERCYGHAIDDPACTKNRAFFEALKAWEAKFSNTDDAHTFEYYLDRVLYRGLYPFLPDVILRDIKVYKAHGIQTHLALMVGTAFVPQQTMLNLPLFARGNWNESLDTTTYIAETAARVLPGNPEPWRAYFAGRAEIFQKVMRWEHETESWCDYRWLPETTLPVGPQMVAIYEQGNRDLIALADKLEKSIAPDWPKRTKDLAVSEVKRTRFEAAEVAAMVAQQDAANHAGAYLNTNSPEERKQAIQRMQDTLALFDVTLAKAHEAGIKEGDYYYMFNDSIRKEINSKIARWHDAP